MDADRLEEQSCGREAVEVDCGDSRMGDAEDNPDSAVGLRGAVAEGAEHGDGSTGEASAIAWPESSEQLASDSNKGGVGLSSSQGRSE